MIERVWKAFFCLYFSGILAILSYSTTISCRFAILQIWHGLLGIFRPKIINLIRLNVKNRRCWDSPCFYLLLVYFQRLFYTQCVKPCIANLKLLTIDVFVVWLLTIFFFALLPNLSVRSLPLSPQLLQWAAANGGWAYQAPLGTWLSSWVFI